MIIKVLLPAVLSPLLAGIVALIATYLATASPTRGRTARSRRGSAGQIVSASMVALAHGTNDAQKTMGIITLTLITAGLLPGRRPAVLGDPAPPGLAIALGTYLGGWRIIQTMGKRVSEIQTPQGFAAETSRRGRDPDLGHLGFALSTTQVATGSIFGAGAGRRLATVQWSVAGQMALAWLLTLQAAAAVGAVAAWASSTGTVGTVVVAIVLVALAGGIYAASRRKPVTADNVTT